ncbi:MAG: putative membrane protein YhhN [Paraglaciecola sp.]|jgi:uncharacterized membrane protein YhhN
MTNITKLSFWVLAVSYLVAQAYGSMPYSFVHKALPIFILLFVALIKLTGPSRILLSTALFLSATGDILLALDLQQGFIFGLLAFAFAHLFYTACFYRWQNWQKHYLWLFAALAIHLTLMLYFILPVSGQLLIPVVIYMGVIAAMTCSAIMVKTAIRYILFGAVLFVTSDSLLAINKFLFALPYENILIMSSYYAAQYFLILGCIDKASSDAST